MDPNEIRTCPLLKLQPLSCQSNLLQTFTPSSSCNNLASFLPDRPVIFFGPPELLNKLLKFAKIPHKFRYDLKFVVF
jgi:hypothetical protein